MPTALLKPIYKNVIRYTGDVGVPQDIKRRRQWSLETMRRMGTPVLIKHMYNVEDVEQGIAEPSPNFATVYNQVEHNDEISHGMAYVSTARARHEWIIPPTETEAAKLFVQQVGEEKSIPNDYLEAPLYRGFGPGYLTYAILPDAPEDIFKVTEPGALIRTQQARLQLPFWPVCGDNDLLVLCELNGSEEVVQTFERYQLKQVSPITMRGRDRWGRRETNLTASGNRFQIGQYCEADLVPPFDPIYNVETDR